MDDLDFFEDDDQDEIEDLDFPIDPYDDMLIDDTEYLDDSNDCVLDQEFIDNHLNVVPSEVLHNFPFVEDDVDAITDYELFSKGFGYLDENKVNKDELSNVAYTGDYNDLSNKPDIPDMSEYVKKDTTELENYPLTSSLSSVAFSGDYDDLSDKPTIPTKTSDITNDSGYITKEVNDLTYYTKTADLPSVPTKTSDLTNDSGFITNSVNNLTNYPLTSTLSSVAFSGDYDDLSDKPVIPSVGNSKLWYGTSSTGASTQVKVVTCDGFTLETGATIIVTFTTNQTYSGQPKLNVNNTGAIGIQYKSGTAGIRYMWTAGSTIQFVYDGTNFICEGRDLASTTYYGITKLNNTVTSTSTALAATANSVKVAYDLANSKQDAITSNNKLDYSLIDNTPTIPTVPSNVSAFNNDAGYITNSVNNLTNYTTTSSLNSLLANKENVIVSGSNANGNYEKFDNGMMIEWGTISISGTFSTSAGGGFYRPSSGPYLTFPESFISVPSLTIQVMNQVHLVYLASLTKDGSYFWPLSFRNGDVSGSIYWIAIGKWK